MNTTAKSANDQGTSSTKSKSRSRAKRKQKEEGFQPSMTESLNKFVDWQKLLKEKQPLHFSAINTSVSKGQVTIEFSELENVEFEVTGYGHDTFAIKKDGQEMHVQVQEKSLLQQVVDAFNSLNLAQVEEGLKEE